MAAARDGGFLLKGSVESTHKVPTSVFSPFLFHRHATETHFAPVNGVSSVLKCRYVRPSARDSKRARFNVYMSHDWEYGMHMLYFKVLMILDPTRPRAPDSAHDPIFAQRALGRTRNQFPGSYTRFNHVFTTASPSSPLLA